MLAIVRRENDSPFYFILFYIFKSNVNHFSSFCKIRK